MKTNKKKSSTARKLLPAVAMLTVSAISLSSATYAWFTMNKQVEVTGMQLRTKVGANLFISTDNVEANYSPDDLLQGRMGLLEPVSSINGATGTFYYTVNANADGQKQSGATISTYNENNFVANTVAGKVAYDSTFNNTYGIDTVFDANTIKMTENNVANSGTDGAAYGYIDYVFYLKATAESTGQKLNMTECNLLYDDAAISSGTEVGRDIDRAWRVAVFATDITNYGGDGYAAVKNIDPAASADVDDNQKGLLGLNGATYFTSGQAQTSNGTADVINFKNISNGAAGVTLDTMGDQGSTNYYKVLVRIWLEGEDNTCNSETYAQLQNNWKLNCKFELGNDAGAVNGINSDIAKVQSGTTFDANNPDDVYKSGT